MNETLATISQDNVVTLADFINAQAEAGNDVRVNGTLVKNTYGTGAVAWGTGSLSVRTQARTTRGTNDVWFKVGTVVTITVQS